MNKTTPAARLVLRLAAALWLLSAVGIAAGRDIYVNNLTGNDRNRGERKDAQVPIAGPVQTIAKGLRLAVAGDRVVVANTGTSYHEEVSLVGESHSGTNGRDFVFDGGGATLDGSVAIPDKAWEHWNGDVFRFRPVRLGTQQLFLGGRPAREHPLTKSDWRLPALEPLEWTLMLGYVYFRVEPGRDPASYHARQAGLQTGITLYHVHNVRVWNLITQGYQQDGINAHDSAMQATIAGVTSRGNGRSGISVGGASRVTLDQCLVGDNGRAQLRTDGYCRAYVLDTTLLEATAPAYVVQGGRLWIDGTEVKSSER